MTYTLTVLAAWTLGGRPQGAESYLLEKITGVLKRRQAARVSGVLES
jgi:hypothetical protein